MDLKSTGKEIAIAFIFAVVFYQLLSIFLSVGIPVTSVVSNSMDHNADFDKWWSEKIYVYQDYEFGKEEFSKFPFRDGIHKGDIIVSTGIEKEDIQVGDVIVFRPNDECFRGLGYENTVIHRVVRIDDEIYTMGDSFYNNVEDVDSQGNSCIVKIEGKAIAVFPLLGYPRLVLFELTGF